MTYDPPLHSLYAFVAQRVIITFHSFRFLKFVSFLQVQHKLIVEGLPSSFRLFLIPEILPPISCYKIFGVSFTWVYLLNFFYPFVAHRYSKLIALFIGHFEWHCYLHEVEIYKNRLFLSRDQWLESSWRTVVRGPIYSSQIIAMVSPRVVQGISSYSSSGKCIL